MNRFKSLALDVEDEPEEKGFYGRGNNMPQAIGIDEINMSADGESDLENSGEILKQKKRKL